MRRRRTEAQTEEGGWAKGPVEVAARWVRGAEVSERLVVRAPPSATCGAFQAALCAAWGLPPPPAPSRLRILLPAAALVCPPALCLAAALAAGPPPARRGLFVLELPTAAGVWPLYRDPPPPAPLRAARHALFCCCAPYGDSDSDGGSDSDDDEGWGSDVRGEKALVCRRYGLGTAVPGVCGLVNLGNTCYLNSVVQCLAATPPLRRLFATGAYRAAVNAANDMGSGGRLADATGALLARMWDGYHHRVAPRAFKEAVGDWAPRFRGYQQQDAHELLTTLLDGLAEDLNGAARRPYAAQVEGNGTPDVDASVAARAWAQHLARNDSDIARCFHGLLRSTVCCPDCRLRRTLFEPFVALSLPLPAERAAVVPFFAGDGRPVRYAVCLPVPSTVAALVEAAQQIGAIPADTPCAAAEVSGGRITTIHEAEEPLCPGRPYALYPIPADAHEQHLLTVALLFRRTYAFYPTPYTFATPLLLAVDSAATYRQLYDTVWRRIQAHFPANREWAELPPDTYPFELSFTTSTGTECRSLHTVLRSTYSSSEEDSSDDDSTTSSDEEKEYEERPCSGCLLPVADELLPAELQTDLIVYLAATFSASYLQENANFAAGLAAVPQDPSIVQAKEELEEGCQLDDCLRLFLADEHLGADDAWQCPSCDAPKQASKKFDLWQLPEYLVVHLKRFQYTDAVRQKLTAPVYFSVDEPWDLAPHVCGGGGEGEPPPLYRLYGFVVHTGGLGGGHYYAYCWHPDRGCWHLLNDSRATRATAEDVQSAAPAAYLLFFQRI